MIHTLGLVVEFSDLSPSGFVNSVIPQIVEDLKSAKKNLGKNTSRVVHVLLDVSEVKKDVGGFDNKIIAMLPVELGKVIRGSGWDTIYYGVDNDGAHWTTKEPQWFNGTDAQRFRADEVLTAESTIVVSGVDVETPRYRDLVYWVKKRRLMLRSIKPGVATWFLPDDEKAWAKLRGQQGNSNLQFDIEVAEVVADKDGADAFDTGNDSGSATMSRPEATAKVGYTTSSECGADTDFLEFSIATCSVCHLCTELKRLRSGDFCINSEEFLVENIGRWAEIADKHSARREFCIGVDIENQVVDVNLPSNLSTCNSEKCAGLCEVVGTLSSALMYYGNLGIANTRVSQ